MAEYAATIKYRVRRMEEYLKASTEILSEIIKGKDLPKPSDYIASHPTLIAKAKASKLTAKSSLLGLLISTRLAVMLPPLFIVLLRLSLVSHLRMLYLRCINQS